MQLVIVMFSQAFPYLRPSASRPDLMVMQSSPTLIKQSEMRTFRQELGLMPSVLGPLGSLDGLLIVTPCIVTLSQNAGLGGPERRVYDLYILDKDVGTFVELDKRRAEHTAFQ